MYVCHYKCISFLHDTVFLGIYKLYLSYIPQLQLGELLHDDMFGLFEAMSAIEMMDPKMDAGMVRSRFPFY